MRVKRMICMMFACLLIVGSICVPVHAAEEEKAATASYAICPRATGQLNFTVAAKTTVILSSSFSLEAGEKVTFNVSYSPSSANMDFGLVDSDGTYYYFTVTNGSVYKSIQIEESGSYTLQVRNNSSREVKVSGFVNY